MTATKDRKSKFTASVNQRVVAMVDEQAARLKLTRSDIVEQAMELWLRSQTEQDEEHYFTMAAAEMNADAQSWNALTSRLMTNRREQ